MERARCLCIDDQKRQTLRLSLISASLRVVHCRQDAPPSALISRVHSLRHCVQLQSISMYMMMLWLSGTVLLTLALFSWAAKLKSFYCTVRSLLSLRLLTRWARSTCWLLSFLVPYTNGRSLRDQSFAFFPSLHCFAGVLSHWLISILWLFRSYCHFFNTLLLFCCTLCSLFYHPKVVCYLQIEVVYVVHMCWYTMFNVVVVVVALLYYDCYIYTAWPWPSMLRKLWSRSEEVESENYNKKVFVSIFNLMLKSLF